MPIKVVCQCGQRFAAKEHMAGRTAICPKCSKPLKIPQPGQSQPERPKGPEPPEHRDGVADLLDEAGIGASAPASLCPGCQKEMPAGAIICIFCGYNQKLGRKMDAAAEPAGPAQARAVSGDRSEERALRKSRLALVATGLILVFWGAILRCAAPILAMTALGSVFSGELALSVAGLALLVGAVLDIVGAVLCLNVPERSQAKGLIISAVILQVIGMVGVFAEMPFAGLLSLAALIVFLFFLKQLATYLRRSDLAEDAQTLIGTIGALTALALAVLLLSAVVPSLVPADRSAVPAARLGPPPDTSAPFLSYVFGFLGLGMIAAMIALLVLYLRLLARLHGELARARGA